MKTKGVIFLLATAALVAGCVSSDGVKCSGTRYAAEAFAPYVEKGELPGAINVFYNNRDITSY